MGRLVKGLVISASCSSLNTVLPTNSNRSTMILPGIVAGNSSVEGGVGEGGCNSSTGAGNRLGGSVLGFSGRGIGVRSRV